jgi:hypothetical protein
MIFHKDWKINQKTCEKKSDHSKTIGVISFQISLFLL